MPNEYTILLFGMGAMLVLYAAWWWRKVLVARQSPIVDAVILKTEIIEIEEVSRLSKLIKYQPKITFSATVNGAKIHAHKLCPDDAAYIFLNHQHAQEFANNYPIGSLTHVRLISTEPAILALIAEVDKHRTSHYLAIAASGVIIWAVMCLLIWLTRF